MLKTCEIDLWGKFFTKCFAENKENRDRVQISVFQQNILQIENTNINLTRFLYFQVFCGNKFSFQIFTKLKKKKKFFFLKKKFYI
jgi:hypothetical protein